jgi:hypothetical protein
MMRSTTAGSVRNATTTQIYSYLSDENLKSVADQQKVGLATMEKKKSPERRLSY